MAVGCDEKERLDPLANIITRGTGANYRAAYWLLMKTRFNNTSLLRAGCSALLWMLLAAAGPFRSAGCRQADSVRPNCAAVVVQQQKSERVPQDDDDREGGGDDDDDEDDDMLHGQLSGHESSAGDLGGLGPARGGGIKSRGEAFSSAQVPLNLFMIV